MSALRRIWNHCWIRVEEGVRQLEGWSFPISIRIWMRRWKQAEKELESVKIEDEVSDVVCDQCGRQHGH